MELTLHIGAHRTGSSAVVRTLLHNADTLEAEGIEVWPPPKMRDMPEFRRWGAAAGDATVKATFASRVDECRADKLFISEENMIGSMVENLRSGLFYNRAAKRLAAYAQLFPVPPKRIALGIRDYLDWWSSGYAYFILKMPLPPFEHMIPAYAAEKRGWLDLVNDVRAAFPDSEILVWPMRAIKGQVIDVAAWIAGRAEGRVGLNPLRRMVNTSPGPNMIPALMEIRAMQPEVSDSAMRKQLAAGPAPAPSGYRPWGLEREVAFVERYAEDIAALKAGHGGVVFHDHADMRDGGHQAGTPPGTLV